MAGALYKNSCIPCWPLKKSRKTLTTCMVLIFVITLVCYMQPTLHRFSTQFPANDAYLVESTAEKYLIYTSKCKIRSGNPFNEDVIKFISSEPYVQCSSKPLLSYIEYNNSVASLHINQSLLERYYSLKIYCCYSEVERIVEEKKSDDNLNISECRPFEGKVVIDAFIVKVTCSNVMGSVVYANVHTIISQEKINKKKSYQEWPSESIPYSVLLVGIDSISKLHLARKLPKVHNFLEENDFINLKGYTKIGDNTFPNLMAILTGRTWQEVYDFCKPNDNKFNGCDIIWDRFSELGYITAYAEDESTIGTFHYERLGFDNPPTDLYFRPYIIAAEALPSKRRYGLTICSGPENAGERILNIAKDFLINLNNLPKFGLFWMNSFSHNNFNIVSSMDDKLEEFLHSIYPQLKNTILVFFSDHGFRFGDIRHTHTGWLEERLPFIYVHFPESFKMQHSPQFKNFVANAERLTNPFDLYMTLQDLLQMTNHNYEVRPSQACPDCQSLFKPVAEERTCKDAAIDQHWCLCTGYAYISPKHSLVIEAAQFIILELNKFIAESEEGYKCAGYYFKQVMFAGISDIHLNGLNQTVQYLLVHLETRPSARFEATVSVASPALPKFRLLGDFSRTDMYAENSRCISGSLKKYCYCDGIFTIVKSAMCNFLNCF